MSKMVSIIVPVYNVESKLKRCVESIQEQTYINLEIILVDDGSTDCSGIICDSYSAKDQRIRVWHQENKGLSAARNIGIELSQGDYLFFIDSDDTINKNTISESVRLLEEENADMLIGGYSGIGLKGYLRWSVIPQGVKSYTGIELLKTEHKDIPLGYVWTTLYKKELWKEVRFPVGKKYEDTWTFPEILIRAKKVVTYPGSIYNYYENEGSIMHSKSTGKEYQMRLDLYLHLVELYKEHKLACKMAECMEIYMENFSVWKKKGICFDDKYEEIRKDIFRKYICTVKGIKLKRKIKIIIKQMVKRI